MKDIRKELELQAEKLEMLLNKSKEDIENAPEGTLRICTNGKRKQYYRKWDTHHEYIRQQDMEAARILAQKGYAEKVRKHAEKNLKAIRKFLKEYDLEEMKDIYPKYCADRQALILPYVLPDEQFARQWQEEQYASKDFERNSIEIYTEKGERVRSKSEKILADKFYMLHIPDHYEKPLYLKGLGTIHPDFTLLNVRTREIFYYEHFGMMDDAEYCEKALSKIGYYERNGIFPGERLLISCETKNRPFNIQAMEQKIRKYLL